MLRKFPTFSSRNHVGIFEFYIEGKNIFQILKYRVKTAMLENEENEEQLITY